MIGKSNLYLMKEKRDIRFFSLRVLTLIIVTHLYTVLRVYSGIGVGGGFLDKKVIGFGLYLYTNSLVIFDYSKCFKMQACLPTFTITHRRQWLHQDCHWECGFPVQSGTVLQETIRGSDFCSRTLCHMAGDRTTAYCSERWSWYPPNLPKLLLHAVGTWAWALVQTCIESG